MRKPEPGDPKSPFAPLMGRIRTCKERRTCKSLGIRALYFEPNHATISDWHSGGGGIKAYRGPIDRRVMFVCESPGGQIKDYGRIEPRRCWSVTSQDRRFYKMRKDYGFKDCYITNSVKCGIRHGSRHTDAEMENCVHFLIQELELVNPMVAVGMGNNAMLALRRASRRMKRPPVLFQVTHYSARRGKPQQEWPHEMAELHRLISRLKPQKNWP